MTKRRVEVEDILVSSPTTVLKKEQNRSIKIYEALLCSALLCSAQGLRHRDEVFCSGMTILLQISSSAALLFCTPWPELTTTPLPGKHDIALWRDSIWTQSVSVMTLLLLSSSPSPTAMTRSRAQRSGIDFFRFYLVVPESNPYIAGGKPLIASVSGSV